MPDENGTEATRSDAVSVEESIVGDAEEKAAAVVEEQDAYEKAEQDTKGSDDAKEPADAEAQTDAAEELKVVVSIKGGRAIIGVQQPSSDPHIESFDDHDLSELTDEVPSVIERARAKWENEPKYPAYVRPAPPARRRSRRQQGSAQASTAEGEAGQQQPETPRLF